MSEPRSGYGRKIAFVAIGAAIIGVVVLAIRPRTSDSDKGRDKQVEPQSTSGGTGIGTAPEGSSPTLSASSGRTAEGQPAGSSSGAPSPGGSGGPGTITSGAPINMAQLLLEAKTVEAARAALAAGEPKKALKELEFYDKIPNAQSLRQEAVLLKIEALSRVGRRTDAMALALATRDDPSFNTYQGRIEGLLEDAGH